MANISNHKIIIDNRAGVSVTGVSDVEGFNEETILAATTAGYIIICGCGLNIEKVDKQSGQLDVKGTINSVTYKESIDKRSGFIKKMLK